MIKQIADLFRSSRSDTAREPQYCPAPDNAILTGKKAIVAGGGGQIGAAIVGELLSQGAHVIALDKDNEALERLAGRTGGERLKTLQLDLTGLAAMDSLEIGACDLLVHAAGIQFENDSLSDTDRQWDDTLSTNIAGPVRLTRKLLPGLIERKGNIVMVTSIHAELPSRWANYSAAKAAQTALVREWAVDLAPHGVRVNAIAPGWVSDEAKQSRLALLHQKTIPPEYIARAVTVLASEYYSRFTTGSVVTVDAGASLYSGRVPFDLPSGGAG